MVLFRSFLSAFVIALHLGASAHGQGLFESTGASESHLLARSHLKARQDALISTQTCATVDLTILGIVLATDVCICAEGGVITPASLTRLTTIVTAKQGLLAPIINLIGGLTGAVTRLVSSVLPLVLQTGTTCDFPANSVPDCGGCGYSCAVVNNVQYVRCGSSCVAPGTTCISGIPSRKRELLGRDSLNRCPTGLEACRIAGAPRNVLGFECIDTTSDLEACGGCVTPFAGRPTGQDCSALPNVAIASCLRGACEIETCVKGFELQDGECVETNGAELLEYWEGLQAAVRVAAV